MNYTAKQIAASLDLAVLKPTATRDDVRNACALANKYGIKSVCVAPTHVALAAPLFNNVSCVIGYPHGNTFTNSKRYEAFHAMRNGARELDVVINYGQFLDGNSDLVMYELWQVVLVAKRHNALVKAILETYFYTPQQLRDACAICINAEVDYIKTSTGVGTGAIQDDVRVILDAVRGTSVRVKASGGIWTYEQAARFLDMGCTRIGSSSFHSLLPGESNNE